MIYRHWVNNTISAATRVQLTFSYEQACATKAANAAIDAEWLREIFRAFGYPQGRTPLVTDNAVAVGFANDTIQHAKTKAIDMRYHWIRDRVRQGHFDIFWVSGDFNIADYFTKALPVHEHQRWAPVIVKMPSQETRQAPGPKLEKAQRITTQHVQ